jgi:tetratricopeptide (TPR) repeat protein
VSLELLNLNPRIGKSIENTTQEIEMGKKLVEKLLPGLQKMKPPTDPQASEQGSRAFEIGLENVDSYKGDPQVYVDALGIFQSGQSRPFFFAGAAYVLISASREQDGTYDPTGLKAAMSLLEKAQEIEPDVTLINMIEALIYCYNGRYEDAHLVLDYLHQQKPDYFYLNLIELILAQQEGEVEIAGIWYGKTVNSAVNVPQRLRLQSRMGDFYLEHGVYDKALVMFKEAAHFDKDNFQLWHKVSVCFYRQGELEEAKYYNHRVLRMNDYPPARQLQGKLRERGINTGLLGKLFSNQ